MRDFPITLYNYIRIVAAKRDLVHIFSSFQIISYSKSHLCPLQILSYALEISLYIMELQWPEFFNYAYILIARVNFDALSWKIFILLFVATILYYTLSLHDYIMHNKISLKMVSPPPPPSNIQAYKKLHCLMEQKIGCKSRVIQYTSWFIHSVLLRRIMLYELTTRAYMISNQDKLTTIQVLGEFLYTIY